MPRVTDRLLFKYKGDGSEFLNRIPARDIHESDRDSLTDEDLVALAESPLYAARNDADEEVARAERRVERAAASEARAAEPAPEVAPRPAPASAPGEAKK